MALGPIGGGIASVAGDPPLIQTETVHGLRNGDRIRIDLPDQGPRQECYAKIADGTTFTPYLDAALKNPVSRAAIPAGSMIAALAQNDYAVVSGINFYPGFRSLQGPVRDATLFRDWLRTSAYVPDSQIDFVVSPDTDPGTIDTATPTLAQVKDKFDRLVRKAAAQDLYYIGRRFYIYLSGHGVLPTATGDPNYNETALLMANADRFVPSHLPCSSCAEWFRARGVFDEVILILDCCRDVLDNVTLVPHGWPNLERKRDPARRFYAAATQWDSKSWEKPMGPTNEVHGVFTWVLMEALKNPQLRNSNDELDGFTLARYLRNEVPNQQEKPKNKQVPDFDCRPGEGDLVIFAKWSPLPPVLAAPLSSSVKVVIHFTPQAGLGGKSVELIGQKYPQPDQIHTVNGADWVVMLPPFGYKLSEKTTGLAKLFEVDGQEKEVHVTLP